CLGTTTGDLVFAGAITDPGFTVSVHADAGNVVNGIAAADVTALNLTMEAPDGTVGTAANPILTDVTNVAGDARNGFFVKELDTTTRDGLTFTAITDVCDGRVLTGVTVTNGNLGGTSDIGIILSDGG